MGYKGGMNDQERVPKVRPRSPLPAIMLPAVRGEDVTIVNADGSHYGYIAWSDVYERDGYQYVDVVKTREWWSHELLGTQPRRTLRWPVGCVFVL